MRWRWLLLGLGMASCAAPSGNDCAPGNAGCPCVVGACHVGLACVDDVCVPGEGTEDGGSASGESSGHGTATSSSDDVGDGSEDSGGPIGCADTPPTIVPTDPAAECLPSVPCVDDSNCPDGHACNLAFSPPACELLYCGGVGTPCHDDSVCVEGLSCHAGLCNPCDICGDLCEVDFASDADHCGCCDNPVAENGVCTDGVPTCPGGLTQCGNLCVDLQSSTQHCGTCDDAVPPGVVCSGGHPSCENPSESVCADTCVSTSYDDANCGSCGYLCSGQFECRQSYCSDDLDAPTNTSCASFCGASGFGCRRGGASYHGTRYCEDSMGSGTFDLYVDLGCNETPEEYIDTTKDNGCDFSGMIDTLTCTCVQP